MDQAAARAAHIGTSPRLSVAHGSVEPNQKFAHDRNQDHLAWLAAPTQTIAEGHDLGVPTHGGAGGIEQNDLDAGAAGDKAAPQLPAPAAMNAWREPAERGDFPAVKPAEFGNSASSARAVACATPMRSH